MKILVLSPYYLPVIGGIQTGLFEIYRRLSQNHEIHLITPKEIHNAGADADLDPYYRCDRIRVRRYCRLGGSRSANPLHALQGAAMFTATASFDAIRFRPDVVHANCVNSCAAPLLALRHLSPAPAVISLLGRADVLSASNEVYARHRKIIESTLARAERILYLTDYMVGERGALPRYLKIPYGVAMAEASPEAVSAFRSRLGIPPDARVWVCLSRFDNSMKRQLVLVEALAPLLRQYPSTLLLLAGEGPDRERTTTLIREWGLAERVLMPGHIAEQDIPACLGAGQLFVFASAKETFGVVLAQAMAAGLPIVAMDNSCIGEIVRDGECGLVVPDLDREAMRKAVERLLLDDGLRSQMAARCRQRARTEFHWDRIATRHEQVFQEAIQTAAARK